MKKRGIGFASGWQGVNYHFGHPDVSTVRLELTADLRFRLGVAAADLGQGIPETLVVIASEVLGVPAGWIDQVDPDTAATPDGGATGASRQTAMTGNATLIAAQKMMELLKSIATEILDEPPEQIAMQAGVLIGASGRSVTLAEIVEEAARIRRPLVVYGTFKAPPTENLDEHGQGYGVNQFSYATFVAEVEVDTDTGEVRVLRVDTFVDAGRIVRRMGAEMQVEGGLVMGLGHTLTEEFKQKEGWPLTDSLTTYLIPTACDAPLVITSQFVEEPAPAFGELGVKGMAELPLVPIAPAIISAIYDATGVYVTELPATPERVLKALRAHEMPSE
jgi:CO/xanthine dehydrogenase Mo-binding subunit